jgi:hypothetical protein
MRRRPKLMWPERKRCKACRQFFGAEVIKGEFCSYKCAGKPEPSGSPPRKHTLANGIPKRYFYSEQQAAGFAREDQDVYLCDFCWHWHIGTLRAQP